MDSDAVTDLRELRELAALQGFNLFVFLRELTDLGAVTVRAKINDSSAVGASGVIGDFDLGEALKALLAALRASNSDADKVEGSSSHTTPPQEEPRIEARDLRLPQHLVSAESPVFVGPLDRSGHALVLYLPEEGLDLKTLQRLARCTNLAVLMRRAVADDQA